MSPIRYALAVLTHGDNADVLERTIRSFDMHVTPPPVWRCVYQDGPCALPPTAPYPWVAIKGSEQIGFCGATGRLWSMVANSEAKFDYVFWLEHDFGFKRTVDLEKIALTLDSDPDLAQMALMRGPVNEEERDAGGVVGKHEGRGDVFRVTTTGDETWLKHRAFFTTNPSLMTRQFMVDSPWPDYERECEGRFGIDLRDAGWSFGIWGDGSTWVQHIGARTGVGY